MRVYLPATIPLLAQLERDGEFEPPEGYAVTPSLRDWYAEDDEEGLEYAASTAAARGSLLLLAADPGAPRRRVVVAADVPDARVALPAGPQAGEADPGAIEVKGVVRLADVASLHVDEPGAEQAVTAALEALPAADKGDPAAVLVVDAIEDYDLLWYGAQELRDLI
jgi:hypothetical protein